MDASSHTDRMRRALSLSLFFLLATPGTPPALWSQWEDAPPISAFVPTRPAARPSEATVYDSVAAGSLYVQTHAQALDWRKLFEGTERLVYLGDIHWVKSQKTELASHMGELRDAGITHFGLEMFETDDQASLDRYCENTADARAVNPALERWGWGVKENLLSMLKAACAANLKLVALNYSFTEQDEEYRREVAARISDADRMKIMDRRMAENIVAFMGRNPGARVVYFVGKAHITHGEQAAMLRKAGISTAARLFVDGVDGLSVNRHVLNLESGIRSAGMDRTRISLPAPTDGAFMWSDLSGHHSVSTADVHYIFVPEVLAEAEERRKMSARELQDSVKLN